ncbi:uncharacterized protein FOMMEDRAFT_165675 [Fomitiporia mediterranea MF3/22]|uniref:uncharacterized protein n=1 Tax=Fomitiporia mediterranea (strain MF3/22) TaxID=694068 RepID=UPI00044097BF|nr:uncharacterized protein FOMMEDRAFT_165675 [Fomitiporia mediterranea MF3/22]EJD07046.1 hypothetical protein FOMMEDRAFT_165675 [Fomitiporia mediterranea MF3/22]
MSQTMSDTIIEEGDPSPMFTQGSLPAEDSQFSYGTGEDSSAAPLSPQYGTYTYKPGSPHGSLDSVTLEGQAKKEVVVRSELLIKDAAANVNNSEALLAASKALFEAFKESAYEAKRQRETNRQMSEAIKESAYEAERQREKLDVLLSELDTVKLHVEHPQAFMDIQNLRNVSDTPRDLLAQGFRAIWGPRVYPSSCFYPDRMGRESKTCHFAPFVKAVYVHYERLFNKPAPLKLHYESRNEETKSIRSISSLKPERSDFLNIDFDKVKRDEALNLEMVLKKKSIVVKGNQEEANATKLTFSEFTSCFLQAYDRAKDLFKVTKEEFVPHELLPDMTVEERGAGLEGMIRAHKRFIIEFREEVARSEKQKGPDEGHTHRDGSDTSSNDMSKRHRLFSPLKKAWNRLKATEKKKDAKTKFSERTAMQFLVDKLKAFEEAQARYVTIGRATAVLLNDNLLELCVNTDREFRVMMNQYVHGEKSINADIKKAVKNARNVLPQLSAETVESFKLLYDIGFETRPAERFDPGRDFETIINNARWPSTQHKHNDSRFKGAPITTRDDRTTSAQPNPSRASLPSSGQSQAISAGNRYSQPSAHLLQTTQQPAGGNQRRSETIQVSATYNSPTRGSYASRVGLSSRPSSKASQGSATRGSR